jgi:hypothetical protein
MQDADKIIKKIKTPKKSDKSVNGTANGVNGTVNGIANGVNGLANGVNGHGSESEGVDEWQVISSKKKGLAKTDEPNTGGTSTPPSKTGVSKVTSPKPVTSSPKVGPSLSLSLSLFGWLDGAI